MIDISFSELALIAVVALVVIGPERLPKVARTLGHMMGRLQRYVSEVKADINREIELDELRKLQAQVQSAASDIEQSVTQATREVEAGVRSVETQLNEAASGSPSASDTSSAAAKSPAAPVTSPDPNTAAEPAPHQASLPGFERL